MKKTSEPQAGSGILDKAALYGPLGLLVVVSGVFLWLLVRKGQVQSLTGDAAVPLALFFIVATVIYLNPGIQIKVQNWARWRREEKERQFWQGREKKEKRQAIAQEIAAEERRQRLEARAAARQREQGK